MVWDEWETLKADAAARQSTGMQLDQLAPSGSGGGQDLVVYQDDLGAVGHDAYLLFEGISEKADIAGAGADKTGAGTSARAASSLTSAGFAMGPALKSTVEIWTSQVDSVRQACAHISDHLDFSKKRHAEDDAKVGSVIRGQALPVSRLNEYFK
ncbi:MULTISPECIES: hypothetical protein [Streptomyces]|uniref:AG1 protein n=1 Tax=Streptomyces lienomycini TaxID=284035 RepID=A0ABV9WTB8_9ACTN|nr:hypothetical protein [Streptomyces lienomycini]